MTGDSSKAKDLMKPRMFIGSSVEALDIAYAAQESLDHVCESTVWSQGIFELSRYAMESLLETLADADFALFVFSPDDVTKIRDKEFKTVRDNVVFELGLFIGGIGRERCFIIVPRKIEDFHLPTDLLGMTPGTYDSDRIDGNLVASLGPALNRVRRAVLKLGTLRAQVAKEAAAIVERDRETQSDLISDKNDVISMLQSWWGSQTARQNSQVMVFTDIDKKFGFEPGMTENYIEEAVARWGYSVERRGKQTILFKDR